MKLSSVVTLLSAASEPFFKSHNMLRINHHSSVIIWKFAIDKIEPPPFNTQHHEISTGSGTLLSSTIDQPILNHEPIA